MMKNKSSYAGLATAAVLWAGALLFTANQTEPTDSQPAIVAPSEAAVGELISFDYDAKSVDWVIPGEDYRRVGDTEVVASFRQAGLYQVISAGKTETGVEIAVHYVNVGGDPAPCPSPDEDQIPEPEPDPRPDESYYSKAVAEWASEVDLDVDTASKLADNFDAAAEASSDIDSLVSKTAELNRPLKANEILGKIQASLLERVVDEDYETHLQAWRDIATGLRNYSSA